MDKISVITPSFNQGRFIERTIHSVLSQNIIDLEYVIVDGGSSDNTIDVLKKYKGKLRWISEVDAGQADAVNKGINMTSGAIIGWLNSDDIYYPEAIKTACDYFATHPEVDIVYGQANHIDEFDQIIQRYDVRPWNIKKLKSLCYISQPATFFRRRVVERFGLLDVDLNYCMDYEYWLRLAFGGARFAYIKEVLAGSRFYPETKTCSAPVEAHKEVIIMLQKKVSTIPTRWFISYAYAIEKTENKLQIKSLRFVFKVLVTSLRVVTQWNERLWILLTYPWVIIGTMYAKRRTKL